MQTYTRTDRDNARNNAARAKSGRAYENRIARALAARLLAAEAAYTTDASPAQKVAILDALMEAVGEIRGGAK